ncbi:MAG: ATP-binding protein [Euzebya sp.]
MIQLGEGPTGALIQSAPEHAGDARATAVLAVLGGVSPEAVAERYGVARGVLDRWVGTFVEAGREGVAAGGSTTQAIALHRDRYLGLIAHELRSPLTMIKGWTDVLDHAEDDRELQAHALGGINVQVSRLQRLADDALDATSVALGRLELNVEPHDLGQAVREVVDARSLQVPDLQVKDDVRVMIDIDRFGQILDNLLENARKHGHGTPRVTVRGRGLFGEVAISSPGAPIPPQVARRMFEPFERGSTTVEGLGLGLHVCRSLIVAHHGQIGLKVDDDGNHFWLRLPISEGTLS